MKKHLIFLLAAGILAQTIKSQTPVNQGKPIAELFTDFHYNLNDTSKTTGFGLTRAYIGYSYQPAGDFSGTIIFNVGSPDDLSSDALPRRYSFFREASVSYKKENLNMSFGMTTTRIFDFQQKFWGKRYVANSYQSINGYGYVADLGLVVDYKFNDILTADFTLMNGEGYNDLQLDNALKPSLGIIISPVKEVAIRLYGDVSKPKGILQYTLIGFIGFKNDLIMVGGEASYKKNLDMTEGHNAWGISATGGINLSEKIQTFARYDYSTSAIAKGEIMQWNYKMDGSFIVYGFQYTFNPNVRMALDYQGILPYNTGVQNTNAIYLNAHFKF